MLVEQASFESNSQLIYNLQQSIMLSHMLFVFKITHN